MWSKGYFCINKWGINCFGCQRLEPYALECLNKRIIILRDYGEVESTSDEFKSENMTIFEDACDVECVVDGESLVIKRYLNV